MAVTIERNKSAQWFAGRYPPKATWPRLRLFLLHCTETPSRSRHGSALLAWPGYDAGAKAPNATLLPDLQAAGLEVREHFPANSSARALRNGPGAGETNATPGGVHQVELAGTCSRETSREWRRRGLVPDVDFVEWWRPPGWVLDALAAYWVDLHRRYGVPLELGSTDWPAYPSSPEADRRARMSRAKFERARGLVGHLHAPENEHLDPGDFPAVDLLRRARALAGGVAPASTVQEDDDMQLTDRLPLGPGNKANLSKAIGRPAPDVFTVQDALTLSVLTGARLTGLERQLAQLAGQIAGLTAALKQAGGTGVDLAAVESAAKRGTEAALDGAELRLTPGD